jgi:hypothetical protein
MSKLPSSYRAEHEAILRDVFHLLGIVQMSVATGKQGITHTALLEWIRCTLDRAGAEPSVDLDGLMAAARENEAQARTKAAEKPALRAVK